MKTPFGEIELWDGHLHFLSRKFFESLAKMSPHTTDTNNANIEEAIKALTGFEVPPEDPLELAKRWLDELQKHEVAAALLIASIPNDEESVAAAVKYRPGTFYGAFFFDPTQPQVEARAKRALDELGLSVACLFPAMHHYSIAECEGVRVLAELAANKPRAIFVHCGVLSIGIRQRLGIAGKYDLRFSNPLDLHIVAKQFPQTKFIIPHFGAGMFREALMVADQCPNIYLDTSGTNAWMKYETLELDLAKVYKKAAAVIGYERLIFGTDSSFFPRGWQRKILQLQLSALEQAGADAEQASKVLGGNLKSLLS
ncbi:MAG: amidohydrolase family protein [Acidobacteriota bacterium]|nr:amidohydrolase [Blastocatellia bacterium]MDW8412706.1 amidohydrolase family protein [Acidobacteriota bacterium]